MLIKSPKVIYDYLDKYVKGQDAAKRALSVGYFSHSIKCLAHRTKKGQFDKSTYLFYGPSGCGKTFMLRTLCNGLGVPFISVAAKDVTPAGYKGKNLDEVLEDYLKTNVERIKASAGDQDPTFLYDDLKYGIIHIDEFDKICQPQSREGSSENWAKSQQQSWLNCIEGFDYNLDVPRELKDLEGFKPFSTRNILFVLTGSFAHLDKIKEEKSKSYTVGFTKAAEERGNASVFQEELIQGGMIKELTGRIHTVTALQALTKKELVKIIKSENGIYKQYQKLFGPIAKVNLSHRQLVKLAEEAYKIGTGARALHTVVEQKLQSKLFDVDLDFCEEANEEIVDKPEEGEA